MMTRKLLSLVPLFLIILSLPVIPKPTRAQRAKEIPREWIDPDTGHRVVRLSDEPGSASLYFHQNAYTPDGERLIITTPAGLSAINLRTQAIAKIVDGRAGIIIVGRKTGQVYHVQDRDVYVTDPRTRVTREIAKLPIRASVTTVNADASPLAG